MQAGFVFMLGLMRKAIGQFLLDKGVITAKQVDEILNFAKKSGLRFGEAGMELGILTHETMLEVFGPSYQVNYFHLDSKYFPENTKTIFPPEFLIRHGILPLGYKTEYSFFRPKRRLNIGFLTPSHKPSVEAVEAEAQKQLGAQFAGIKIFLILADQFLVVLNEVYGVGVPALRQKDPAQVNATLSMFLD